MLIKKYTVPIGHESQDMEKTINRILKEILTEYVLETGKN